MFKKKKFIIGGLIVVLGIGYLAYTGFVSSATYYYEVNEVMSKGNTVYGQTLRVHGMVVAGTVKQEAANSINFTLADMKENKSLTVFFKGVAPDTFKAGSELVAEGTLSSDGIFQATTLMPKCASKYAPK